MTVKVLEDFRVLLCGSRAILTAMMALLFSTLSVSLQAQGFERLFSFSGTDGAYPFSGLVLDTDGNIYGTTYAGGSGPCTQGCGFAYKLDPSGQLTLLHGFTGVGGDGATPDAGLVLDTGGVYGTTLYGGAFGDGTVFKITAAGHETILYSFAENQGDGKFPFAGLLQVSTGALQSEFYGTNLYGGTGCSGPPGTGCGTIYKVNSSGNEQVLYSFTGTDGDGAYPLAGVIQDASGNLYGTTEYGGSGFGTVYKLDTNGRETVLYAFSGGADGALPQYGYLALDSAGNLYGTTSGGGSNVCPAGCGVVFKVNSAGSETVLYSFTDTHGDGANPYAGVIRDAAGNLYGTTFRGGNGFGTVYKLDTSGRETVLHAFDDTDGADPHGTLVLDASGNLYGSASRGGSFGLGTIFKLTP